MIPGLRSSTYFRVELLLGIVELRLAHPDALNCCAGHDDDWFLRGGYRVGVTELAMVGSCFMVMLATLSR